METSEKRTIGPVTTSVTAGYALAGIICWGVETFAHIPVPTDVQTYFGIVLGVIGGYLVRPKGKHA